MPKIRIGYFNLTEGLSNEYAWTYDVLIDVLNSHFHENSELYEKTDGFDFGFLICTKKESPNLQIKGPRKSKKYKVIEYSLFLPTEIKTLDDYLEIIWKGFGEVLGKFEVSGTEVEEMSRKCTRLLKEI